MRCVLVTCNGYRVLREVIVSSVSELPSLCRIAEEGQDDEYAVYASHNGVMVANSEGVIEENNDNAAAISAVDMACGYDYL